MPLYIQYASKADVDNVVGRARDGNTHYLWTSIKERCSDESRAIVTGLKESSHDGEEDHGEAAGRLLLLDDFIECLRRDITTTPLSQNVSRSCAACRECAIVVLHYLVSLSASVSANGDTSDSMVKQLVEEDSTYRSVISDCLKHLWERANETIRQGVQQQPTSASNERQLDNLFTPDLRAFFFTLTWQQVPSIVNPRNHDFLRTTIEAIRSVKAIMESIDDRSQCSHSFILSANERVGLLLGALDEIVHASLAVPSHSKNWISEESLSILAEQSSTWGPVAVQLAEDCLRLCIDGNGRGTQHQIRLFILQAENVVKRVGRLFSKLRLNASSKQTHLAWISIRAADGQVIFVEKVHFVYQHLISEDKTHHGDTSLLFGEWLCCLLRLLDGNQIGELLYLSKRTKLDAKQKTFFLCLMKLYAGDTLHQYLDCIEVIACSIAEMRTESSFGKFITTGTGKHAINCIFRCLRPILLPQDAVISFTISPHDYETIKNVLKHLCAAAWPHADDLLGISIDSSTFRVLGHNAPVTFSTLLEILLTETGVSYQHIACSMVAIQCVVELVKGGEALLVTPAQSASSTELVSAKHILQRKGLFGQGGGNPDTTNYPSVDKCTDFLRQHVTLMEMAFHRISKILSFLLHADDDEQVLCIEENVRCNCNAIFIQLCYAWQILVNATGRSIINGVVKNKGGYVAVGGARSGGTQSQALSASFLSSQIHCTMQHDEQSALVLNESNNEVAVSVVNDMTAMFFGVLNDVFLDNAAAISVNDPCGFVQDRARFIEAFWWLLHRLSSFNVPLSTSLSVALIKNNADFAFLSPDFEDKNASDDVRVGALWFAIYGGFAHSKDLSSKCALYPAVDHGCVEEEEGKGRQDRAYERDGVIEVKLITDAVKLCYNSIAEGSSDSYTINKLVDWLHTVLEKDYSIPSGDAGTPPHDKMTSTVFVDDMNEAVEAEDGIRFALNHFLGTIWNGVNQSLSQLHHDVKDSQVITCAEGLRRHFSVLLSYCLAGQYPVSTWLYDDYCQYQSVHSQSTDLRKMFSLWISFEDSNDDVRPFLTYLCTKAVVARCTISTRTMTQMPTYIHVDVEIRECFTIITCLARAIGDSYAKDGEIPLQWTRYIQLHFVRVFFDWIAFMRYKCEYDGTDTAGTGFDDTLPEVLISALKTVIEDDVADAKGDGDTSAIGRLLVIPLDSPKPFVCCNSGKNVGSLLTLDSIASASSAKSPGNSIATNRSFGVSPLLSSNSKQSVGSNVDNAHLHLQGSCLEVALDALLDLFLFAGRCLPSTLSTEVLNYATNVTCIVFPSSAQRELKEAITQFGVKLSGMDTKKLPTSLANWVRSGGGGITFAMEESQASSLSSKRPAPQESDPFSDDENTAGSIEKKCRRGYVLLAPDGDVGVLSNNGSPAPSPGSNDNEEGSTQVGSQGTAY